MSLHYKLSFPLGNGILRLSMHVFLELWCPPKDNLSVTAAPDCRYHGWKSLCGRELRLPHLFQWLHQEPLAWVVLKSHHRREILCVPMQATSMSVFSILYPLWRCFHYWRTQKRMQIFETALFSFPPYVVLFNMSSSVPSASIRLFGVYI